MTFPVSPTNGQVTTVNGITYTYNSTDNAWSRTAQPVGNLTVSGNVTVGRTLSIENTGDVSANIGAYQTYANSNAVTQSTSINIVNANLGAYQTWANTSITSLYTNANANTAAYLTTYTGNIQAGNISVTGNVNVTSNVFANKLYTTNGLYWAGNGNVIVTGGGGSGGTFTASNTTPSSASPSDFWYYVAGDVLFQYINDGDSNQWVDVSSPYNTQSQTITDAVLSNVTVSSWANVTTARTSLGITPTTVGVAPPGSPNLGDTWYNTNEDVMYQYINDGVGSWWVDISSDGFSTIAGTNLLETTIQGNLLPSANITYNLGSTTQRFKDLFLSGTTIDLGGATIKTDATSGAIALIPQPTVANPNPTGIVVSPAGTVSTVSTTGGTLATNAISNSSNTAVTTNTTTFGNITTSNVYADRFFYSNGTAFSSSSFGNTDIGLYLSSSNAVVGTSAINVPSGNTAQRPSSPLVGMIRYNTSLNRFEGYLPAGGWQNMLSDAYSIDYIIVAGGGAGGVWHAGGGGAGGVLAATGYTVTPNNSYPISVGAGGSGGSNPITVVGTNGTDSTGFGYTAIGGGRGGNYDATAPSSGGSGAGGNGDAGGSPNRTLGAPGTAGQGYAGGNGIQGHAGGGGGGAGGVGGTTTNVNVGGAGGIGYQWLNGTYYAGGGGGGTWSGPSPSSGGTGGGGNGSYNYNTNPPTAGTVNTGGGGGGSGAQGNNTSWAAYIAGGSGVVIVRYLGTQRGTGGTVTSASGYTYHTFTGSGSFTA